MIVAVVIAVMIPSGAYAVTAITRVVIEDSGAAHTPARVTPPGALMVAQAAPDSFVQSAPVAFKTSPDKVAAPPKGKALIVTILHVATFSDPTPGSGNDVEFFIVSGTNCAGTIVGSFFDVVWPGSVGEIDVPLAPGLGVPAGDSLCASQNGSVGTSVGVSGFTVPATSVASLSAARAMAAGSPARPGP
jgi:hypothetical protein